MTTDTNKPATAAGPASTGMRYPEQSDISGGATDCAPAHAVDERTADSDSGHVAAASNGSPGGAVVYPPDGTVSPFTVINLGSGAVRVGDAIHDGRLPALWFGTGGEGMGHEAAMNRAAHDGETIAVVTFANVDGLDVLLDVIERCRRVAFPGAPARSAATSPRPEQGKE